MRDPVARIAHDPACANWLDAVFGHSGCDVAHLHALNTTALLPVMRRRSRLVVFGHHNVLSERHLPDDIAALTRALENVDRVVCVSERSRNDFAATTGFPAGSIHVIPNPSFLATGTRQTPRPVRTVGTASNLGPPKGIGVLLKAWQILRQRGGAPSLFLAGGSRATIRHWSRVSRDLGVADCVRFVGRLEREREMDCFYRQLDAVVVASTSEAFPLLSIEAISRGIPVIASDIESLREVVGEASVLFPSGDSGALADCVQALAASPSAVETLGNAGYALWKREYSPEAIMGRYERLYSGETAV